METSGFDDDPPPEPRDGWLLVRIHVPELNVYKCLQFPADRLVWDVKQQVLASLPKVSIFQLQPFLSRKRLHLSILIGTMNQAIIPIHKYIALFSYITVRNLSFRINNSELGLNTNLSLYAENKSTTANKSIPVMVSVSCETILIGFSNRDWNLLPKLQNKTLQVTTIAKIHSCTYVGLPKEIWNSLNIGSK